MTREQVYAKLWTATVVARARLLAIRKVDGKHLRQDLLDEIDELIKVLSDALEAERQYMEQVLGPVTPVEK
jgi:hypothetical protein